MRKIIFFDIDGTISIEETGEIPKSAVDAIRKARENGHLAFINSGRTLSSIEEKYKQIGFDGYVCGCGTDIYEGNNNIYRYTVPKEICMEIIKNARETKVTAVYESATNVYYDPVVPKHEVVEALMQSAECKWETLSEKIEDISCVFEKFCVWVTKEADFPTFQNAISDYFTCVNRGGGMYEIIPKDVSKATGIQFLLDYYGIPLENCFAIGDSTNDLTMLQYVPNSIAMGNSMKEILPYCSYQTADIREDGLQKALEYFEII